MITEIFTGILIFGVIFIMGIIILYILGFAFVLWWSKKEMFEDKYNWLTSDEYSKLIGRRLTEQEARYKAEWHTR